MKILFIETKMGVAGDMLTGALYGLLDQKQSFVDKMNSLFPNILEISITEKAQCGINGNHVKVLIHGKEETEIHTHEHSHDHSYANHMHYTYQNILDKIDSFPIDNIVKEDAKAIYTLLGQAEAKVHNTSLEQIHFHEVGSLDAILDVVACSYIIRELKVDRIICSPIHVGNGTVKCAHGILPVPAPATAELLKGIPYYTGQIESELCTPTGAAILKHFVNEFSDMPVMNIENIGYGMGNKEFKVANMVRTFIGSLDVQDTRPASELEDLIYDISCNIDDMTPEALGYAMDILLEKGALDVYFHNIHMKKNRPGIELHCLCTKERFDEFSMLILKHTSTRGIRYQEFKRRKLISTFEEKHTKYGDIRIKHSEGYGIHKAKAEFDDVKEIAREYNLPLATIYDEIKSLT